MAENIRNNKALRDYRGKEAVYVSGNQYSKYGPLSHIEFLSENWVPGALFGLMLSKNINTASLNKRHQYKNGYLIDKKYNRREKVNTYINIYDSQGDKLFRLPAGKLNDYIDSLPANNRHWVQILRFKPVKDVILALMPRLKYALDM